MLLILLAITTTLSCCRPSSSFSFYAGAFLPPSTWTTSRRTCSSSPQVVVPSLLLHRHQSSKSPSDNDDAAANSSGHHFGDDEYYKEHLEQEKIRQEKELERMKMVRKLQDAFYMDSNSEADADAYDDDGVFSETERPTLINGGELHNIPLWRVPWIEIPGRTNVLSVHEPIYTNMFETLLRRHKNKNSDEKGWYFGHLYHDDKKMTTSSSSSVLRSWQEHAQQKSETNNNADFDSAHHEEAAASSVLGTLMKITDYRRMKDGKLLLLVQAIERFVVTKPLQQVPYATANIQLLPDREEIQIEDNPSKSVDATEQEKEEKETILITHADGSIDEEEEEGAQTTTQYTEDVVGPARAMALVDSWEQWYPYEFEKTQLPLPQTTNMEYYEVVGSAIAKVLPYAVFDNTFLPTEQLTPPKMRLDNENHHTSSATGSSSSNSAGGRTKTKKTTVVDSSDFDEILRVDDQLLRTATTTQQQQLSQQQEPPLEVRLLEGGIFKGRIPDLPDRFLDMSLSELEFNLWMVLNDFLIASRTPVSPVLLGLMPPQMSWPKHFLLEKIADTIQQNSAELQHKYVRVSSLYPAIRRQKKLSYYAARVLEEARRRRSSYSDDYDSASSSSCVQELRQELLQIPSTKLRLAYVLWKFEIDQSSFQ